MCSPAPKITKTSKKRDRIEAFLNKVENENYSRTGTPEAAQSSALQDHASGPSSSVGPVSTARSLQQPNVLSLPSSFPPVYDPVTGKDIVLSDEDIAIIKRIQVGSSDESTVQVASHTIHLTRLSLHHALHFPGWTVPQQQH
jgi:hypothetical protein